jgi:hypothetical protein
MVLRFGELNLLFASEFGSVDGCAAALRHCVSEGEEKREGKEIHGKQRINRGKKESSKSEKL